jgi:hypothetical protein
MYTVYEPSPRRSPRHVRPTADLNSSILRPKTKSPIRKSNAGQSVRKPLSSANALAKITGNDARQKLRKRKVNDENKENCNTAPRPVRAGGLGVNGRIVSGKNAQPFTSKTELRNGRLPLKELPLNFGKGEIAPSVEIVVHRIVLGD